MVSQSFPETHRNLYNWYLRHGYFISRLFLGVSYAYIRQPDEK